MGEELTVEDGIKSQIKLDTEVANGIKHAVVTLDESKSGKVAKSQLQALVANISQAIKTSYVSDDLENYLPDNTDLTVTEFLDFLENQLLAKGKKLNSKELDELSWVVVGQKYEDNPHMLTKKDAFKLWLVFKKLDVSGELRVDVEELCVILEKFVRGIGVQWNELHLTDYEEDGAITFWKFIDCLERKFLIGVEKNVLREGLQELYDLILDEVTRTGFLTKKGHGVLKSQKSRWFVLKPDKLTYYVSSGYREKKGEVIINKDAKVTSIPDKGSYKCRFAVTCGTTKKDYEQAAPDQRTKQAWITDIQTAIDCFGGQTPLIRDLVARKAKRDENRARKADEERKRLEQEDLLDQQRREIDLLKMRKEEIEKLADEEKAMLDAEIKRREELEEIQRNLQLLLEEQKRAREEDERIRAAKERLLEEERIKREQLEALRLQQQEELQNEKIQKEELIEKQKEQQRILEEERKRLQHLEEERMKAEEQAKAAKDKLIAAEQAAKSAAEQAKDRVRQIKTSIGLKGTVGPKVDPLVTHRGKGAFTLEEFLNRATEWSGLPLEDDKPKLSTAPEVDELVKASATPASNQNIPEFLKKAAAWSGLNPDTYLESTPEKNPPPKVAAKPPRPSSNTASGGEQGTQQGKQVLQAGKQVLEESDEGIQDSDQGLQEAKPELEVVCESSRDDDQGLKKAEQVQTEGERKLDEGNLESKEAELASFEDKKESEVGGEKSNVVVDESVGMIVSNGDETKLLPVDSSGSTMETLDSSGSQVVAVDNNVAGAVDNDASELAVVDNVADVVDNDASELAVVDNGAGVVANLGPEVKREDVTGDSNVDRVVQDNYDKCEGGEKDNNEPVGIDGNAQGSRVVNQDISDPVDNTCSELNQETGVSNSESAVINGEPEESNAEIEPIKVQQEINGSKTEVDDAKPGVVNTTPEINGAIPEISTIKTEENEVIPEVDNIEPEKTEKKDEQTEVKDCEPEVVSKEPEVDNKEPEVDNTEPIVDKEPEVNNKEPEVNSKEPGSKEPEVDSKEPDNKEPKVDNKEPEVENKEPEMTNKKPEIENAVAEEFHTNDSETDGNETTTPDTSDSNVELPSGGLSNPKGSGNIVENGQCSDNSDNANEHPSNAGDVKPEVCKESAENIASENVEVASS